MASIHGFNTWDEVAGYIENTLGIHYTDDPTLWTEAMKAEMEGSRFVKIVNDVTGEVTEQIVSDSLYTGVGEFHTGVNYQGETISGGGVKSAPTAKSIITENSGGSGGTAVITDEAIGVIDTGVSAFTAPINVFSGLLQVFGLIHAGVEIANAQVWKDMSNYVYDTDFTEDTPLERVVDFLEMRITNYITDSWEIVAGERVVRTTVPESIAKKMYAFLANHMIQEQTPGIFPDLSTLPILYTFYSRTLPLAASGTSYDRYMSVSNYAAEGLIGLIDITDDLVKTAISDYFTQIIAMGYTISNQNATAVLASVDGLMAYLKEQSVDDVDNAQYCHIRVHIYRGTTPPPIDTPLSINEIFYQINCYQNDNITYQVEEGRKLCKFDFDFVRGTQTQNGSLPDLETGYSYQRGDVIRYLKRGHTGDDPNDYAYIARLKEDKTGQTRKGWQCSCQFYGTELQRTYYSGTGASPDWVYMNGFTEGAINLPDNNYDVRESITYGVNTQLYRDYSNIGYVGIGESYMPDDYLVTAGIQSKNDTSGNPEVHPNPNKTMEETYPEMDQKKQNARPQAQTDPVSGDTVVNNYITNYVPAAVPSGSENTNRLINHGLNNTNDNQSYIDNRPQTDKAQGRVNLNDPVDGWNEDVNESVNRYNETRNDPYHYPDPIPANEPNPQYPTNPPADPEGETDDPTSPTVLPGIEASGMVSVYNPTKAEVISFSSWLWTGSVFENIKKLLQDPMEAIIGMHIMYATPHTTTPSNIIVGWLDSGVSAKVVDQQYTQLDCGDVFVPEYYGDVLDYEPYVHIHMYLPFVGIVSLKPNDVIGKLVNVTYGIDALTGTCLAMVTTTKGGSKIQCYTFPGNCAVQIPLTGGSYAQVIRGIASMAVGVAGSVATGNALGAVGGVIGGVMASHLDVSHSGTLGANAGAMGIKKPYIIITRKVAYDAADYNQFYGYPANKTVILGSCKGYTRVKSVHIESIPIATSDEKQMIETLLKQGIIIR